MQKVSAAIFFLVLLLNMPPFNQLGKLPYLLQHYKMHRQQDSGLTLGSFIQSHYFGCEAKAADQKEHRQLPFKQMDRSAQIVSLAPANIHSSFIPAFLETGESIAGYRESTTLFPALQHIFRPPRV